MGSGPPPSCLLGFVRYWAACLTRYASEWGMFVPGQDSGVTLASNSSSKEPELNVMFYRSCFFFF